MSVIINGYDCPILFSFLSSAIVGGVTQSSIEVITGLSMGLDAKTSLNHALSSLPESMLISGTIGSITTGASMSIAGINPFTGNPYNMVSSTELGLNEEVNRIRNNIKYNYTHDGAVYENRESILPSNTAYREYVVPSENIKGPGHLRIVVGKNGSWYYTPDHFKTFIKFRP